MKRLDGSLEEILARLRKGEKAFISNVAPFPSQTFPVGSSYTVRLYTGRTETKWGTLLAETTGTVTEEGLTIHGFQVKPPVNPATGEMMAVRFTFWIVRPEGVEQYAGYHGEIDPSEPPSLDSMLTKSEYIN